MGASVIGPDVIRRTFFNTSIADIYRAIQGRSLVGAYTLLFCSMNAIAYIDESTRPSSSRERMLCESCKQPLGQTKDSKAFQDWVKKWIKQGVPSPDCNPYFLYAVRNALVHVHGMPDVLKSFAGYLLNHDAPFEHWKKFGAREADDELSVAIKPGFVLNLDTLLAEYVFAANKFFRAHESNWSEQESLRQQVFSMLGIVVQKDGEFQSFAEPPRKFEFMHPALQIFDFVAEPTVAHIQAGIHELFKETLQCKCLPHVGYPVQHEML